MNTIMAEQLLKALKKKGGSVPLVVEKEVPSVTQNRLSGEFNGDDMPMGAGIGDIFLMRLDGKAAQDVKQVKSIIRPVMIWGIYRDQKNEIRAVDVIYSTTKSIADRFLYASEMPYSSEEEIRLAGTNRPGRLGLSSVSTLPWISCWKSGLFFNQRLNQADPSIFPHLFIRRYQSLTHNPVNMFSRKVRINPEWSREGLFLPASTPVLPGDTPPEIDCGCQRLEKPLHGFDRDMISRAIHWSENFSKAARANGAYLLFPGISIPYKKWPDWEEFSNPDFIWTPPGRPVPQGFS